jgi:hypothetical protein
MQGAFQGEGTLLKNDNTSKTNLSLWFTTEGGIELLKTTFKSPDLHADVCAVRGRTGGAYSTQSTFQWTAAVQALSVLLLKAAIRQKKGIKTLEPLLEGGKGSLASSIDGALYKQNAWLDLFGTTAQGDSLSRKIITRTNPGRRRFGPVLVSINERLLPADSIHIFLDNQPTNDTKRLEGCVNAIESNWAGREDLALQNPLRLYNPLRI